QLAGDREIHKRWPADVTAVRNRAALRFDEEAQMTARVFVLRIHLARRHLHRARELGSEQPFRHLCDALPQDADTLLHLLHLHPVSVPAVAERAFHRAADAYVEFETVVHAVRPVLAKIERDAAAADHRSAQGVTDAEFFGADADVRRA